jgi:EAL domain-containing protein (putative c-di-GMP-specific phosphodiesterase class I)/GGDEF domain-containing protein
MANGSTSDRPLAVDVPPVAGPTADGDASRADDLVTIVRAVSGLHGQRYLDAMTRTLASCSGMEIVFVASVDADTHKATTLSVCEGGARGENFSYDLADTPCREVSKDTVCVYPRQVCSYFPADQMLVDMGIEAYCGAPLYDAHGQVVGLVVMLHREPIGNQNALLTLLDVAGILLSAELTRSRAETRLSTLLNSDPVTGLPSRHALQEYLAAKGRRTLLMVRVRRLAELNEAFGFRQSNRFVASLGRMLQERFQPEYMASMRTSTFAMVVPAETDVPALTQEIADYLLQTSVVVDQIPCYFSALFGAATSDQDLIHNAATALALARERQSLVHLELDSESIAERRQVQRASIQRGVEMHEALRRERFIPVFQKIINLNTNEVTHYEALLRLYQNNALVAPSDFLNTASAMGTLPALTRQVIAKSMQVMGRQKHPFALNITVQDLDEAYLLNFLSSHCERHGVDPRSVTLELNHAFDMKYAARHTDQLKALADTGFRLAIDKFGSGSTHLPLLLEVPFSYLKIHGKIVKAALTNERAANLIRGCVQLARSMGVTAAAERISCPATRDFLVDAGVQLGQGKSIAEPTVIS